MFEHFNYGTLFMILAASGIVLYLNQLSKKEKSDPFAALYAQYDHLTADQLSAIPDNELVRAVAINVISKTDRHHPDVYQLIPFLSHGRLAIYCVWLYCHELEAGTLTTLMNSPTGRFAQAAADGFSLIGAEATCAALLEAVQDPANEQCLVTLREALTAEQPLVRCVTYIRDNPAEFLDS